jgi:hypothetical protein
MKRLRFVLVLAFLIGIVALGSTGVSWAAKLIVDNQGPAVSSPNNALPAGSRPLGTVKTTPVCVHTNKPGKFVIGSKATLILDTIDPGKFVSACVAGEEDLPAKIPGNLLTSPIKLLDSFGSTLQVKHKVCFPVPPGKKGIAYYWTGNGWAKTENANNDQACATVPGTAPNPTYVALGEVK